MAKKSLAYYIWHNYKTVIIEKDPQEVGPNPWASSLLHITFPLFLSRKSLVRAEVNYKWLRVDLLLLFWYLSLWFFWLQKFLFMWGWCSQLQPEDNSSVHGGSDLVDFVASNVGNPLDLDNLLNYGIPIAGIFWILMWVLIILYDKYPNHKGPDWGRRTRRNCIKNWC